MGGGGLRLRTKALLTGCCISDSLLCDMQHGQVVKKLNFDFLTPPPESGVGSAGKIFATMLLHS